MLGFSGGRDHDRDVALERLSQVSLPGAEIISALMSPEPLQSLARRMLSVGSGASGMDHATDVFVAAGFSRDEAQREVQGLLKSAWALDG